MWDFFTTVRHRHSIRKYQPDMPIEPTKLHAILEMACAAPSAGDLQSYRIIVVRDLADRQALVHAAHQQTFIAEAPVCLVFCADPARSETAFGERGAKLYAMQDATIAAAYAQLAIVAAGMGSTWVGYFEEEAVISYTHYLAEIDEGRSENVAAPRIAIRYWNLPTDSTLRDVVLVVRADEAHHRDVNHGFANDLAGLPRITVAVPPSHIELARNWKSAA